MSTPVDARELRAFDELAERLDKAEGKLFAARGIVTAMQRKGWLQVREAAVLEENIRQAEARVDAIIRQVHQRRQDAVHGIPPAMRLLGN